MQGKEGKSKKYLVITPARNEEEFIERTIKSMISQSILPCLWIIVDDGSTDQTPNIVNDYCQKYPWIKLVMIADRGYRKRGSGIVGAFYEGLKLVDSSAFDFIVNMDADISFKSDYFERLLHRFNQDSTLGIASGACYIEKFDHLEIERNPIDHARGAGRVYRQSCWSQIGGMEQALSWDVIDELKAQTRGWKTRSFEDLVLIHHRPTAAAEGIAQGRIRGGLTSYYIGYHPIYLLIRSVYLMTKPPYIIGGLLLLYGYSYGYIKRMERVKDRDLIRFVRKKQLQSLLPMTHGNKVLRDRVWSRSNPNQRGGH